MATRNRKIVLVSRPSGEPTQDNFKLLEEEIPTPGKGQLLLRTIYLSLDPYMRGRMNAGPSYAPPVGIGEVMEGRAVCQVIETNLPEYQRGEFVFAPIGWQEYSLSDGAGVRRIDPSLGPISYALGVLGMPGLTAYTGLLNIGQPKSGETLVLAAASGAVGSVVGQIGRIKGCHVVGIAGGADKCRFVKNELGFDDCLDHREPELPERLAAACPDGIDIYFENVGGHVFDAVLPLFNNFASAGVRFDRALQRKRAAARTGSTAAVNAKYSCQATDIPRIHRFRFFRSVPAVSRRNERLAARWPDQV